MDLKKLGYETVKVVDGIYILSIEEAKDKNEIVLKEMEHRWLELNDLILETDLIQVREKANEKKPLTEPYAIFKKKSVNDRYIPDINISGLSILVDEKSFKYVADIIFPDKWIQDTCGNDKVKTLK